MKRIYRYEVPVDGDFHAIACGPVLAVGCRDRNVVEFWAYPKGHGFEVRHFRVAGTGHVVDDEEQHVGTAVAPGGDLVWHLVQRWDKP
jgi:hypothetical protein